MTAKIIQISATPTRLYVLYEDGTVYEQYGNDSWKRVKTPDILTAEE